MDYHFPSSPYRRPTHVVRVDRGGGLSINGFCSEVAAKSWVDLVLAGEPYRWKNSTTIVQGDIEVSCPQLEDVMECEDQITLPYPYPSLASQARGGAMVPFDANEHARTPDAPTKGRRTRRSDGKNRPRTAKSTSSGVSLQAVCDELSCAVSAARRVLRKHGIKKPYVWEGAELERVSSIIKAGVKR